MAVGIAAGIIPAGTATMDGTVTMAGTAITDGTAGTTIGSDRPASGTPEHRPCNAGPVRQRLHGPRNFDARG